MDPAYEAARFALCTEEEARRYMKIYLAAARRAKQKHGARYEYRARWVESAYSFRHFLQKKPQNTC